MYSWTFLPLFGVPFGFRSVKDTVEGCLISTKVGETESNEYISLSTLPFTVIGFVLPSKGSPV
jgi:hypothetical protein